MFFPSTIYKFTVHFSNLNYNEILLENRQELALCIGDFVRVTHQTDQGDKETCSPAPSGERSFYEHELVNTAATWR